MQAAPTTPAISEAGRPDSTTEQARPDQGFFTSDHWRANFQTTYLWQKHPGFSAAYTGEHSLVPTAEVGYTLTATAFLGLRPWTGTELFFNPEMIQSVELSHLHGLGGLTNGENQKGGSPEATLYMARLFVRQTIALGSETSHVEAGANQFAGEITSRRLVVSAGNMALIDIFDTNPYTHDARTQFMNWSLLTHGASDYAADARGYSWGLAVEYYHDDWAFRIGRFAQPKESNGLAIDFNVVAHYGDNVEIEHRHTLWGQPGKVRLLGLHNYARMGNFRDALEYSRINGGIPSVANVRKGQSKYGFGVAFDQSLYRDVGVFVRGSWNDGQTETYAFTEIERSLVGGVVVKGRLWLRPADTVGLAGIDNGLSSAHRAYLAAGGLGAFIGDGAINYHTERIVEVYYSLNAFSGLWLTAGFQHIVNPAYNADRGPVNVYSGRIHAEF